MVFKASDLQELVLVAIGLVHPTIYCKHSKQDQVATYGLLLC